MRAAIARSLAEVPSGKRGLVSFGVSQLGAEVGVGWRPRPGVAIGGYGVGLWRGGWAAGVRGTVVW